MPVTIHPLLIAAGHIGKLPIDERLIGRLDASLTPIRVDPEAFARRFFEILFRSHPDIRSLFPLGSLDSIGRQIVAHLEFLVGGLRSPRIVCATFQSLGRRHVRYGVRGGHYLMFRRAMVAAMRETSGEAWSETLTNDWTQTLDLIGIIMQQRDPEIVSRLESPTRGGTDARTASVH